MAPKRVPSAGWKPHTGGPRPVHPGVRVQVQLRSDEDLLAAELSNPAAGITADAYQWEWAGRLLRSANIVAFREVAA